MTDGEDDFCLSARCPRVGLGSLLVPRVLIWTALTLNRIRLIKISRSGAVDWMPRRSYINQRAKEKKKEKGERLEGISAAGQVEDPLS